MSCWKSRNLFRRYMADRRKLIAPSWLLQPGDVVKKFDIQLQALRKAKDGKEGLVSLFFCFLGAKLLWGIILILSTALEGDGQP